MRASFEEKAGQQAVPLRHKTAFSTLAYSGLRLAKRPMGQREHRVLGVSFAVVALVSQGGVEDRAAGAVSAGFGTGVLTANQFAAAAALASIDGNLERPGTVLVWHCAVEERGKDTACLAFGRWNRGLEYCYRTGVVLLNSTWTVSISKDVDSQGGEMHTADDA